jgi:preprotein translocase subunit SecG
VILFADVPFYVHLLNTVVLVIGIFLVLLVLIQRGKGGGSPFGSRAGDAFTRFTLIIAAIWALSIMVEVKLVQHTGSQQSLLGK